MLSRSVTPHSDLLPGAFVYDLMFILVTLPVVVTHVARTFATRGHASSDAEAHFRELAETIPAIIWTALPGKGIDYCKRRFQELQASP